MREIKARAWFPKAGRMIHFEGIDFCDEYDQMCLGIRQGDCTEEYQHLAGRSYIPNEEGVTSWYTGLKDKNGKEIYEGDILVHHDKGIKDIPYHCFYEVKFGEYDNGESWDDNTSGCGWWLLEFKFTRDSGEIEMRSGVYDYRGLYGQEEMEVIGNIYENPELLDINN